MQQQGAAGRFSGSIPGSSSLLLHASFVFVEFCSKARGCMQKLATAVVVRSLDTELTWNTLGEYSSTAVVRSMALRLRVLFFKMYRAPAWVKTRNSRLAWRNAVGAIDFSSLVVLE
jgi:hypothetical protein